MCKYAQREDQSIHPIGRDVPKILLPLFTPRRYRERERESRRRSRTNAYIDDDDDDNEAPACYLYHSRLRRTTYLTVRDSHGANSTARSSA